VLSPRSGSATIWAACLPSAHALSVPDRQTLSASEAASGESLPPPAVPGERRLWNQSDVAEAAVGPVSGAAAAEYAGMTAPSAGGPAAAEAAMVP
jgi:hypothetical protein